MTHLIVISIFSRYKTLVPPVDNVWAMVIFRRIRRKIIKIVLCCIAYDITVVHSDMHACTHITVYCTTVIHSMNSS